MTPDELRILVLADVAAGKLPIDISRERGVTQQTIRAIVNPKPAEFTKFDGSRKRAIVKQLRDGYSIRRTAADFSAAYAEVQAIAAEIGVRKRKDLVDGRTKHLAACERVAKKLIDAGVDPTVVRANFGDVV